MDFKSEVLPRLFITRMNCFPYPSSILRRKRYCGFLIAKRWDLKYIFIIEIEERICYHRNNEIKRVRANQPYMILTTLMEGASMRQFCAELENGAHHDQLSKYHSLVQALDIVVNKQGAK